jgi:hypothetical protein
MSEELNIENKGTHKNHVNEMYQNWFLDYASYVILRTGSTSRERWTQASATPYTSCFERNG